MSTRMTLWSTPECWGWWLHVFREQGSGRLGIELIRSATKARNARRVTIKSGY
jgi:hypothetical protein